MLNFIRNLYMPAPSASKTSPDSPSTPPETSVLEEEDQTTPKATTILPPQINVPQNGDNSLMPPPSFIRPRTNNTTSSTLAPSASNLPPQKRLRKPVILGPGHSPLDWARLKSSGTDLRVIPHPSS